MKKVSLIPYVGGKYYYSSWIIENLPKHTNFVDVFGGAASVILNKPKVRCNVYNDLNKDLTNLLVIIRDESKKFIEKLSMTPYSRVLYDEYFIELRNNNWKFPDFERAFQYFYYSFASFSGNQRDNKNGWAFSIERGRPAQLIEKEKVLLEISKRLKDIHIDNIDYRKCIKNWDRDETMFYCDPPYYGDERKEKRLYKYDMNKENEHIEFLEIVNNCKGNVAISGYNSNLYDEYLKDWTKLEKETSKFSKRSYGENAKKPKAIECLWIKSKNGLFG